MANIVETIEIRADGAQAVSAAKSVESALTSSFLKAQFAVEAFHKVAEFAWESLKEGVKAALENERATLSMQAAMRVYGLDVERTSAMLDLQAHSLSVLSNVSESHIRQLQTQALHYGINESRITELTSAAISLSNTTGKDLSQSFEQLVKSLSGTADETLRLIPGVSSLTVEQLHAGEAINVVNAKLGENLTLLTQGTSGAATGLTEAWADFNRELVTSVGNTSIVTQNMNFLTAQLRVMSDLLSKGKMGEAATVGLFGFLMAGDIRKQAAGLRAEAELNAMPSGGQPGGNFRRGFDFGGEAGLIRESMGAPSSGRSKPGVDSVDESLAMLGRTGSTLGMDMVMLNGILMTEDRANAAIEFGEQLQQRASDRMEEITEANEKRRVDIIEEETARQMLIQDLAAQRQQQLYDSIAGTLERTMVSTIEAIAEGQKISAMGIATGMVRSIGHSLVARGVADLAQAVAIAANPYTTLVSGPLFAAAASEISIGAGMIATGRAMGGGAQPSGSSGGGGGGGYTGGFGGASGGGRSFASESSRETPPITIVFNGPTTAPEVGLAIQRALGAARNMGYL